MIRSLRKFGAGLSWAARSARVARSYSNSENDSLGKTGSPDWSFLTKAIERAEVQDTKRSRFKANFLGKQTGVDKETRSELKEKMIFSQIFDSVLAKTQAKVHKPQGAAKPVSNTLHSLFETNDVGQLMPKTAQPAKPFGRAASSESNRARRKRDATESYLQPIFAHIDSLATNKEVVNYFTNTVVPTFKPQVENWDTLENTWRAPVVCPETAPAILAKCLDTLTDTFSDPLGAQHIFERVKLLDLETDSAMCDAEVYNRMIALRWEYYLDPFLVVDTVSEMFINGVRGNAQTAEILGAISRTANDAKRGSLSADKLPLWTAKDDELIGQLVKYRASIMESLAAKSNLRL